MQINYSYFQDIYTKFFKFVKKDETLVTPLRKDDKLGVPEKENNVWIAMEVTLSCTIHLFKDIWHFDTF